MSREALVVDDDEKIAKMIAIRLKRQGFNPATCYNGTSAAEWALKNNPILVLLDVRLPDISGVDVLKEILKNNKDTYVIMISAHADIQIAVECIKFGAFDFLEKPFELAAFDAKVKHIARSVSLEEEVASLKRELGASYKDKRLIGDSAAMRKVLQAIELASKSDVSVLVEGESGTGKELVARAIHSRRERVEGPFVAVNCGAIPSELLESELFGHEKGSFTGASEMKVGKFERAAGGTLFLDEIAELPLSLQVKLLRVLQEMELERVGGSRLIPVTARVIAATNQNLKKLVAAGKFREDLYYRVNVFPVKVPPLRERKEDIPALFLHFLQSKRKDGAPVQIDEAAYECLSAYDWPGNIRELENMADRLLIMAGHQNYISAADIEALNPSELEPACEGVRLNASQDSDRLQAIHETEKAVLEAALKRSDGNVTEASRAVQLSRDTFYRKMKKYDIKRS